MSARSMGSHHSTAMGTDVWLTPPEILKPLGQFDIDPCASDDRPWPTALRHFTRASDGLAQPWAGRVWLNPPYGRETAKWLSKLADHGNGVALIFARTETRDWFAHVWPKATGILFIRGRLHFHYPDGKRAVANSGAPSALIAYGHWNALMIEGAGIAGHFVQLAKQEEAF